MRRLQDVVEEHDGDDAYLIRVNPRVARELLRADSGLLDFEAGTGKHFHFEGGDALPISTFEVIESGTREQIEERALPFQVGEEVLVAIEEPHMYNPNDAIARLDSYIVSIAGGGGDIGERKMVRIETVDRATATAVLLGPDGEAVEVSEEPEPVTTGGGRGRGGRGRRRSGAG